MSMPYLPPASLIFFLSFVALLRALWLLLRLEAKCKENVLLCSLIDNYYRSVHTYLN